MFKQLIRFIKCFFLLILFFSLGMIAVYQIPNDFLEPQFSKSISQLEKEDPYPNYLFNSDASVLDNFMDKIMITSCRISDAYDNMLDAAFDNNGYPRYWNGYLLTLRLFLSQFSYQQIRYLNMFFLIISFCFCFSGIQQRLNPAAAFGFAAAVISCFLVFIGESLQYFTVFMILFITILIYLHVPYFHKPENSVLLLFAVGMVTNFFDMLTAPLITLGIPLILMISDDSFPVFTKKFVHQIIFIVKSSLSWGFGYGLTWAAKWAIGTMILGVNVFEDAAKTAQFRVYGSESYPLDRGLMYKLNFETYFFSKGHKPALFIILSILVLIIMLIRRHKENCYSMIAVNLLVGIFPYIWFFVFANHSQLHYFYTYRIQSITLFSIFTAIGCSIDWSGNIF